MALTWLEFLVCTTAIVLSGRKLSRYGDVIAEKTGIGRTWIGVVLMATVTSLPELVTGIIDSCIINVLYFGQEVSNATSRKLKGIGAATAASYISASGRLPTC